MKRNEIERDIEFVKSKFDGIVAYLKETNPECLYHI